MHALANKFYKEGFWSRLNLREDDRATAVLFLHLKSLAYLKQHPDLLILEMPLFDVVRVDTCQRTLCIAFAFLNGEEEKD
jgi:hypothetical protein